MTEYKRENETIENVIDRESIITRPFRKLLYALQPDKVVLHAEQYCHIQNRQSGEIELVVGPSKRVLDYEERLLALPQEQIVLDSAKYCHIQDKNSGQIKLVEGPCRLALGHHDEILDDVQDKVVVPQNQYCVITNPKDPKTGTIRYGEKEVREGPLTFSLAYGEELEGEPRERFTLTKYDSLLIKAVNPEGEHNAGDTFLLKGPCEYVPSKNVQIQKQSKAFSLSDTDGIYVQNKDTGEVRVVIGPIDYFLEPNEQLFNKEMTLDELCSLGLREQTIKQGVRVLTRQAANRSYLENNSRAVVLELETKEVVQIYDGSQTRIESGPRTVFLGPYERPKVLTLSGGKPIQQGALKIALLKLGPDFIYDQIKVRTKDNAQVLVDVTYKWRFSDKDLSRIFGIEDFVGYAAETLSSEIRGVAAQHDFEAFHAKALEYVKQSIYGTKSSRVFDENGLEVFGIDITSITPTDPKIAEKLHTAIEKNMDIYCDKIVLRATIEAERQKVEGELAVEKEKTGLIESRLANRRKKEIESAILESEEQKIRAESQAEATRIDSEAKANAEKLRLSTVIRELGSSENYLKLVESESIANAEKIVVVPTDSKLVLPFGKKI